MVTKRDWFAEVTSGETYNTAAQTAVKYSLSPQEMTADERAAFRDEAKMYAALATMHYTRALLYFLTT
jgi:hypothetical protein